MIAFETRLACLHLSRIARLGLHPARDQMCPRPSGRVRALVLDQWPAGAYPLVQVAVVRLEPAQPAVQGHETGEGAAADDVSLGCGYAVQRIDSGFHHRLTSSSSSD